MCQFVYCNVSEYLGNVFLGGKYVLSGKCRFGKRLVRESSVRESACPGNDHLPHISSVIGVSKFSLAVGFEGF